MIDKKPYLFLFLILILGFFLRIYKLDNRGIWHEEKATVSCAVGIPYFAIISKIGNNNWNTYIDNNSSFSSKNFWQFNTLSDVIKATKQGSGCIAYFITLHYWLNLFGVSEFSIRFLSLLFSLLTLALCYFVADLIFNSKRIALFSCLLFAIFPIIISTSRFGKEYAMAAFFTLLSSYFFFKIIINKRKTINYAGYIFAVSISLLTHILTAYIFIGQGLIMLFLVRDRSIWIKYVVSCLFACGIYVTWLFFSNFSEYKVISIVTQWFAENASKWKLGDDPYYMPATFRTLIAGCIQLILPLFGNSSQSLVSHLREIAVLIIIPSIFIFINFYKTTDNYKNKMVIASIILVFSSPLFALLIAIEQKYIAFSMFTIVFILLLMQFSFLQMLLIKYHLLIIQNGNFLAM